MEERKCVGILRHTCPDFTKLTSTKLLQHMNLATINFQVLERNDFWFSRAWLGQPTTQTIRRFCRKKRSVNGLNDFKSLCMTERPGASKLSIVSFTKYTKYNETQKLTMLKQHILEKK